MEIITAALIAVALIVGIAAHYISGKNDSAVEQTAEAVLKVKGIDIDFSADDKQAEAEKEKANESK